MKFVDGAPVKVEPFVTGFLAREGSSYKYLGRPVGLAVSEDGSLFVSDDSNGAIYRITYEGKGSAGAEFQPDPPLVAPLVSGKLASEELASPNVASLDVTASAFKVNGSIPLTYSAYGDDVSPSLSWAGAPQSTKSYVLIVEDPDATEPRPFAHWLAFNIPAAVTTLREAFPPQPRLRQPEGVVQGRNARGSIGYFGPKPPVGDKAHHYHFQVFALDTVLALPPGTGREALIGAMKGHVVGQGSLVGTFSR